jgi:hypothetical protein
MAGRHGRRRVCWASLLTEKSGFTRRTRSWPSRGAASWKLCAWHDWGLFGGQSANPVTETLRPPPGMHPRAVWEGEADGGGLPELSAKPPSPVQSPCPLRFWPFPSALPRFSAHSWREAGAPPGADRKERQGIMEQNSQHRAVELTPASTSPLIVTAEVQRLSGRPRRHLAPGWSRGTAHESTTPQGTALIFLPFSLRAIAVETGEGGRGSPPLFRMTPICPQSNRINAGLPPQRIAATGKTTRRRLLRRILHFVRTAQGQ